VRRLPRTRLAGATNGCAAAMNIRAAAMNIRAAGALERLRIPR
jgi:hypothetical protein